MVELINDNCSNIILNIIERCEFPIIVTDPPFNIGYKYNNYKDNMPEQEYYNWLADIFKLCPSVIIHYPEDINELSIRLGKAPQDIVSWVYNSNNQRQHRDIAFYGVKPDLTKCTQPYKNPNDKRIKKLIEQGKTGARLYDWWYINQVKNVSKSKLNHPCQMPLEVMERIVKILPDNCTSIDPFMGSGTTGVACKKNNRDFIGIELDKEYYEIAEERLGGEEWK